MTTYLSEHFTLEELVNSSMAQRLGIDNTPGPNEQKNLKILCTQVLEPARKIFGPINISSGYRCKKLNAAVGGVPNSYHVRGMAADCVVETAQVAKCLAEALLRQKLTDIVLVEYSKHGMWLHVQWSSKPRHNVNYHYNVCK